MGMDSRRAPYSVALGRTLILSDVPRAGLGAWVLQGADLQKLARLRAFWMAPPAGLEPAAKRLEAVSIGVVAR